MNDFDNGYSYIIIYFNNWLLLTTVNRVYPYNTRYEIVVFVRMKNGWSEYINFNLGLWNWRFHYTNNYYLWFCCTARCFFIRVGVYRVIALLRRRCRRGNKLSAFFMFDFAPQTVVSPVRRLFFIPFRINSEKKTKKIIDKTQHLWRESN